MSQASGDTINHGRILMEELNRWELDKVTPNNPMVMTKGIPNQNGLLVNSKAMDIIQASHGDFLKKYGRLWIDAGGRPNGHLEPPATRIVLSLVPHADPALGGPNYKKGIEEMNAQGLTTISGQMEDGYLKTYQWLDSRGQMTIRLAYGKATDFGTVGGTDMTARLRDLGRQMGTGTDRVWMNSAAPSNVDGAGSRVCMSLQRKDGQNFGAIDSYYPMGQCNMDSEFPGAQGKTARLGGNYYAEWVLGMGRNGVRFANTHVAGDRSYTLLLNLVEQIQRENGPNAARNWAFDHCHFVKPDDIKRAGRLGVTFSCNSEFILNYSPPAVKAYGDDIANTWVVPVKSMLDAGARVVSESPGPDFLGSTVWGGMELFQTRRDENGKVWSPQERLDRTTTLRMATRWAADYVLRGDKLGSIEPGKWADLLVLDKDYMTIPTEQIHTILPQLTVFDGKIVFLTPAFSQEYNLKPAGAVISTLETLRARRARDTGDGGGG
jgi:predicted amidohydrolase YtcJ